MSLLGFTRAKQRLSSGSVAAINLQNFIHIFDIKNERIFTVKIIYYYSNLAVYSGRQGFYTSCAYLMTSHLKLWHSKKSKTTKTDLKLPSISESSVDWLRDRAGWLSFS